ncbi:MAG: alanine--tRNA ligase [bacterium]
MMTGNEIRDAFLRFFNARGHQVLPSSSLVPDDPTTLFTTAGMQQFVPWFRREVEPSFGSVATVQKCARTDDLDQVGRTARHHTFFEMLGNFSFGDYFKEETLRWGWDFSTLPQSEGGLGLNAEQIWVTYYKPGPGEPYQEDLEAKAIWEQIGVPSERIVPLGKKENWWGPVGSSGPCGPCSEMHYDRGAELACGPECTSPACGCDRWIEFWNHVFQQFNYQEGEYQLLPSPGIDTGAGLERIASLVQDVPTNYDTDLVFKLITTTRELAGITAEPTEEQLLALRVIADHLRCAAFMIADGVLPSNSKRGYVVRRIIRRAYRFGRNIGLRDPFLCRLVPTLQQIMGGHYQELNDNADFIIDTLRAEEGRFAETLERGEELLARLISEAQAKNADTLNGQDVFTLYDTYGFPKELTVESALAAGLTVDEAGYATAFETARTIARAGGKFGYAAAASLGQEIPATEFLAYQTLTAEAKLLFLLPNEDGLTALAILDRSPFYATSGGQSTDVGSLTVGEIIFPVLDVAKDKFGHLLHTIELSDNDAPAVGSPVAAIVDRYRRQAIRRAHTATHLLHWALQQVLGEHAKQAGSLVDADTLRFDFSNQQALTSAELAQVEELVYGRILDDEQVCIMEMGLDEARTAGYTALFGEKYGAWVRTVNIGDDPYSRELCGGTHLERTGQVGYFRITAETSVAAGIRRIEAVTGIAAAQWASQQAGIVSGLSNELKVTPEELPIRVKALQHELHEAGQQIKELKVKAAAGGGTGGPQVEELNGIPAIIAALKDVDAATLGNLTDQYLDRIPQGIVVLATEFEGKVLFAVKVSKSLVGKLRAGDIVREMAKIAGGGGGGRPDFAQAGGKMSEKIGESLAAARAIIAG